MNIYYKKKALTARLYYDADYSVEIFLQDIISAFPGKVIFEFESYEACHFFRHSARHNHYYTNEEWNSKQHHLWRKNFYVIHNESFIDDKLAEIKKNVESIRLSNGANFPFESVAKFRGLTNFLEEPRSPRTISFDPLALDTCYNLPFNEAKKLTTVFKIEKWEKNIKDDDIFQLVAHCAFYVNDSDVIIPFRVIVYSFNKLVLLSEQNIHPEIFVYSNHVDTDLLSAYLKHTFEFFEVSTIEELKLKIATFTEDIALEELLAKPFDSQGTEVSFTFLEA